MIFFDIDGTLLDHEKAEKIASIDFYGKFQQNLKMSEMEFTQLWEASSKKYYLKYLAKQLSF
ncbi:hypothetical protein [Bacillus sp. 03113]|uniref:hypothetical protein n=1 Tax=Bacillus sp. 03113 TaxID=2578211 RepID=UPI00215C76F5|nr:hypothetical protein [Bacillus sp. 03113]